MTQIDDQRIEQINLFTNMTEPHVMLSDQSKGYLYSLKIDYKNQKYITSISHVNPCSPAIKKIHFFGEIDFSFCSKEQASIFVTMINKARDALNDNFVKTASGNQDTTFPIQNKLLELEMALTRNIQLLSN